MPVEQRPQQLMEYGERHSCLGPGPRHRQDPHPCALGAIVRGGQEHRFADARLAPDQHCYAALSDSIQAGFNGIHFAFEADERGGHVGRFGPLRLDSSA